MPSLADLGRGKHVFRLNDYSRWTTGPQPVRDRGFVKLNACWLMYTSFTSYSTYYTKDPYVSICMIFVFWLCSQTKAKVHLKVPPVGRMPRTYCAECPSGISSHYCAMRARNTNTKVYFCCYIITASFLYVCVCVCAIRALCLAVKFGA